MFKIGILASAMRRAIGLLLDLFPNAAAAYSLRKLRTAYTGSAIRVRRSSDNTEQDIGFNGSGNLNETALATFVGSGNIFSVNNNLSSASWGKLGTAVLANQTLDPFGGNEGWLVSESAVNSAHRVYQNPTYNTVAGEWYIISVYLKKGSGITAPNIIQMLGGDRFGTQYANFNILGGTVVTQVGCTGIITDAGDGWWRCSIKMQAVTSGSATNTHAIVFTNNNSSLGRLPGYTGQTTSNIFMYGAQFYAGQDIQTYVATAGNQAGFGFVTKWYEQGYTGPYNFFTFSEQFENAIWSKINLTATANQTTAPDATTTADLIAENTSNAAHVLQSASVSVTSGKYYNQSIYVKKGSGSTAPDIIQIAFNNTNFSGNIYGNFNITTGDVTISNAISPTITDAGNGWWRCSISALCTTSGSPVLYTLVMCNNNPVATPRPPYTGLTTSNVFAWGAQLDESSTVRTYVQTVATAAGYRDAVQTTAANQPRIVNAGVIEKQNGKATLIRTGTNTNLKTSLFALSQPVTVFSANKFNSAGISVIFDTASGTGFNVYYATTLRMESSTQISTTFSSAQAVLFNLYTTIFNSPSSKVFSNGVEILSGDSGTGGVNGFTLMGDRNNGNGAPLLSEIVIYPTNQTSNKASIESNINSYYTIY